MKHHDLPQGSPEWHAHRRQHFNASDAPAMLGCSPYKTRAELLRELHTGLTADVDAATQRRFDDGHRFEALARPLAEKIIGEDLYPVVGSNGKLSASFDGLTMAEDTAFEHKSLNDDLRACMRDEGSGYDLPKPYRVQMEQQLMVSGAERVLFMASKWNGEQLVGERHCWYASDPALRAEILAGWEQFEADLCAYVPPEVVEVIPMAARRPDQLPALRSSVRGELVLESNIKEWEAAALAYIKSVRDHELKTDEDFTNADAAAKWCDASKLTLQGVRAQLMSATGDVNTAVATLDRIMGELDGTRIAFTNAIKARKETRKTEIVTAAARALKEHVATLDDRLRPIFSRVGVNYMPPSAAVADFAGAIRGKSSLAKMQEAVDALLAKAKGAATATAADITLNLTALRELPPEQQALFADTATLVLKAPEDCRAQITSRIAEHRAAEERRAAELAEKERARIRQEEEARAAAKLRQKNEMALQEIQGIQQQVHIATLGRAGVRKGGTIECIRETLAETEGWVIDERFGIFQGSAQDTKDKAVADIRKLLSDAEARAEQERQEQVAAAPSSMPVIPPDVAAEAIDRHGGDRVAAAREFGAFGLAAGAPSPTATVHPMPTRAPAAPSGPPTLRLGQINDRLGFTVTADFLASLGYPMAGTEKAAKLWHEASFPAICQAIAQHTMSVAGGRKAAA